MSVWNKVLVGLVFVASLGFFYLAMRTLKTHQYWRELAQRAEARIDTLKEENQGLRDGTGEGENYEPGTERLRLDLHKMLIDRGRVWYNCEPEPNPETGQVAVTTDLPDPHGIGDKTVLYVFEEADVDVAFVPADLELVADRGAGYGHPPALGLGGGPAPGGLG